MMTVHEVSRLTGISVRTLHYYDKIGLLNAADHTEAGYRLYDERSLERLQQILLFRELEFPLKDIRAIIESPDFDRNRALEQQITLLEMRKEHIENLINFAKGIKMMGVKALDFTAFDVQKIDEYSRRAKEEWGRTQAYKEFEEKEKNRDPKEQQAILAGLMEIFIEFGEIKEKEPDSKEAEEQVVRLQDYITEHFYTCTDEILYGLGKMYAGGGEFTCNINNAAGEGTAEFAAKAIECYVQKRIETGT